ncbi:MAG TPA: MiaB/RimO family radical SAM methylthiotransferase [Thermoanaerobaculia bacterium]|nr:MiaB/RimO family radical SAM methylthiotransferase [Thermoanaerobaculia bacterium]HUM28899.1 MiaB/RimO family radical SAM methylthiotransferase [Thermoanaerobaculia bacterium]HXK67168.1 MiaB/RimO family radical SAM methylthiotransferase [Thermoanaerobaculia bacterium]
MKIFGCRTNQFDGEALALSLDPERYERVNTEAKARVVIIVGCAVTHRAERDVRQYVRKNRREDPGKIIVLAGCSAELNPPEGIDRIIPMAARDSIQSIIEGRLRENNEIGESARLFFRPVVEMLDRTRVYVKVQEGCSHRCSYCIVPTLRGPSRSLPLETLRHHVRDLVARGVPELILTGTYLGGWGRDLSPKMSLPVLWNVMDQVGGEYRWRMSSIEPWAFKNSWFEKLRDCTRLCPTFHLPLQSGSSKILKAMRRPIQPARFAEIVSRIRDIFPDSRIGTDLIVGYPGESESDMEETMTFLHQMQLDYHHVFTFSVRPGFTEMEGTVPDREVHRRMSMIRRFDLASREAEGRRRLGNVLQVLSAGRARGIDIYNHWVDLDRQVEEGMFVRVRITGSQGDRLLGVVV